MIQVQVFDEEHEEDLMDDINQFLNAHPSIQLFDIKFATAVASDADGQIFCFSEMIIYRDKSSMTVPY